MEIDKRKLLWYINPILQYVFGRSVVMMIDEESGEIITIKDYFTSSKTKKLRKVIIYMEHNDESEGEEEI